MNERVQQIKKRNEEINDMSFGAMLAMVQNQPRKEPLRAYVSDNDNEESMTSRIRTICGVFPDGCVVVEGTPQNEKAYMDGLAYDTIRYNYFKLIKPKEKKLITAIQLREAGAYLVQFPNDLYTRSTVSFGDRSILVVMGRLDDGSAKVDYCNESNFHTIQGFYSFSNPKELQPMWIEE